MRTDTPATPELESNPVLGLVLTGGGARGAFQAGALKALAAISGRGNVPCRVIAGVSVGALNAVGVATHSHDFEQAAASIEDFWKSLRSNKVFDAGAAKITFAGISMLMSTASPRLAKYSSRSLLDTSPLRISLGEAVDFDRVAGAVSSGSLKAIAVTCSGYSSGRAVTFFDANSDTQQWHRVRRDGLRCRLTIDHAMASAALPLLFEAVRIGGEYYGDGLLRQTSPLAPAIHLGATRLLVIGTRDSIPIGASARTIAPHYPTLGDLGGYALDTVFHDSLDADIERLWRINRTIENLPPSEQANSALKHVDTLVINPTRDLREMALEHADEMPRALRTVLRSQQSKQSLGRIESYLLFEPEYIRSLFALGYDDTMAKRAEVHSFLTG